MSTFAGVNGGGRPQLRAGSISDVLPPILFGYPEAAKTLYSGTMVGQDAGGNIVDLSDATNPAINVMGVLRANVINTVANGFGSAGVASGLSCEIQTGGWSMAPDATVTATTPYGTDLYAADNQTVSAENAGTRLRCGFFGGLDAYGGAIVYFAPSPFAVAPGEPGAGSTPFVARAVVNTTLAAYVGTTTGVLTASAVGTTLSVAQDTNVTLAVGDVVIVPEGITNLSAASDAGPYVVTALGGAAAKFVLTRPSWWPTLGGIPSQSIRVGSEGAIWANSIWFSSTHGKIVDTDAPLLFPERVTVRATLAAGVRAITSVPILSATKTGIFCALQAVGGTVTTTSWYGTLVAATPGALGTATCTVNALATGMTLNNVDTSILNVTIINR